MQLYVHLGFAIPCMNLDELSVVRMCVVGFLEAYTTLPMVDGDPHPEDLILACARFRVETNGQSTFF